ncbi:hypothetical protein [Curtobacterium flaccumfaciens]|uniref:hypothetical protein n=1 Tax=Curtobacterium flaccumfaciens TaxID=2035 RepID=UPI003992829F
MAPVYLGEAPWHEMQVMKLIAKRFLVPIPTVRRLQRAQTAALNSLSDNLVAWVREATDLPTLPPVTRSRSDPAGTDVLNIVTDADLPPVEDARTAALLRAIRNVDWPNDS